MAVLDEVKKRVSADKLKQLTNAGNANATVTNDTVLQTFCDDAVAEFQVRVNADYDSALRIHVTLVCDLVRLLLIEFANRGAGPTYEINDLRKRINERIDQAKKVSARDLILPETDSTLEPSKPRGPRPRRPAFDPLVLRDMQPGVLNPLLPDSEETLDA